MLSRLLTSKLSAASCEDTLSSFVFCTLFTLFELFEDHSRVVDVGFDGVFELQNMVCLAPQWKEVANPEASLINVDECTDSRYYTLSSLK